ncbi:hypothetical protein [Ohtaekwangia koreensis]|uniref:hypothetical protein n=1 Tax=Ohtaekwangia koreensis TaxID=688867 RepID=UPI0009A5BDB4|nr:hypothetical protein [Ohtaekwangia koreensis]
MSNAKYIITDTFKITGRGLVLTGYISEGTIFIGDTIEFSALNKIRKRRIVGIEGMREAQSIKVNTGLLIQCESDDEIDELSPPRRL